MLLTAFEALAAEFPMLYLLMAGPVTVPGYAEALDKRISASLFRSRIRRLGALPFTGKTMADAYHACDVFVLPSRHEPFGIVVLEAWSAGKPVAVSQVGGLQDLVSDDLDGLFFPSADAARCSDCLRKLLSSPNCGNDLADRQTQGTRSLLLGTHRRRNGAHLSTGRKQCRLEVWQVMSDCLRAPSFYSSTSCSVP